MQMCSKTADWHLDFWQLAEVIRITRTDRQTDRPHSVIIFNITIFAHFLQILVSANTNQIHTPTINKCKCLYSGTQTQVIGNLLLCLSFPTNKSKPIFFLSLNQSPLLHSHSETNKQTTIKEAQITTLQSLIDSVIFQLKFLRILSTTTL